jgi:hypothetical protein
MRQNTQKTPKTMLHPRDKTPKKRPTHGSTMGQNVQKTPKTTLHPRDKTPKKRPKYAQSTSVHTQNPKETPNPTTELCSAQKKTQKKRPIPRPSCVQLKKTPNFTLHQNWAFCKT